ncbi:MAG: cation:proton antiporter [Chlamydiia bacterium]|nr:cation:proton antiporter [Chlamydiia bacterium]
MIIALYAFFFILIGWGSKRLPFIPLLCVIFGIVWGIFGEVHSRALLKNLAIVSVIFFLFIDALRLHIKKVVHYHSLRLPTIGLITTLALGVLAVKLFFPLSIEEAFVVVLPLLAIDRKIVMPAFSKRVPQRVSQMLNVECSLTSLIAFFFLSIMHLSHPFHFFVGIVFPLIAGGALGYVFGLIGRAAEENGWAERHLFQGALFLIPFAVFAFCLLFRSNGYIGVISCGIVFGNTARPLCRSLFDLSHRQAAYLFYLLLVLFGTYSFHILSFSMTPRLLIFALLFLVVIRFLAVLISFQKAPYQWKTLGFSTFFAPKGLIPIALALLFTDYFSYPNETLMLSIVLTTTFFSLLLHPLFAHPVAEAYSGAINRSKSAYEHLPIIPLPL